MSTLFPHNDSEEQAIAPGAEHEDDDEGDGDVEHGEGDLVEEGGAGGPVLVLPGVPQREVGRVSGELRIRWKYFIYLFIFIPPTAILHGPYDDVVLRESKSSNTELLSLFMCSSFYYSVLIAEIPTCSLQRFRRYP